MMKNILKKIKHMIGAPIVINPICDQNIYKESRSSFAGNSLSESNVLVVTNLLDRHEEIEGVLQSEQCHFQIMYCKNDTLDSRKIEAASTSLLGPFTHIINLLVFNNEKNDIKCSMMDDLTRCAYQWLQAESEYLIEHTYYATLCTVSLYDEKEDDIEQLSAIGAVSSLIKGLGETMANHNIIENGIISTYSVPFEDILHSAVYLSSKYGQIMAGEVFDMNL